MKPEMKSAADRLLEAVGESEPMLGDLAGRCDLTRRQAQLAALQLKRRGLLAQHGLRGAYRLTDAGRAWLENGRHVVRGEGKKPRTVTRGIRERAWWHLRAHKSATIKELLTTHATPDLKAPRVTLAKYLSALYRAGILDRRVPRAGGEAVWVLKRDLGVQTPVWRERSGRIWDNNSQTLFVVERAQ